MNVSEKNQKHSKKCKEKAWIAAAVISMSIYLGWRLFFTIPKHETYGWLATVCGILLLASEAASMLEGTETFLRLGKKMIPEKPVVPGYCYPDVDVFIATHNEEPELLYKTVNGCLHMDYPDKNKVHIYICDDGNRPEVAALARKMGVGYFGLADNKLAKAGNLNHALSKTTSPWIVTFDADMIPTHEFLMETVPYTFLPDMKKQADGSWVMLSEEQKDGDYKIGFIQTPQSFYNPDLFQYNFYSENRIPNEQDYFFREVNVGRNQANAVIYAGSNTLISRVALEEVGGIATGTITEDFETGIKIQARGYQCYALDKAVAHGLAPTDIDSLIRQRVRWGRGCVSSLRRVRLLSHRGLKWSTKVSYLSCWLYWWSFFRRLVYVVSPILFVMFGVPSVICTLKGLLGIWLPSYLIYDYTLRTTTGGIRNQRWSGIVDTIIFPYLILPIFLETMYIQQKKFHVTKKTRETGENHDIQLAIPHLILLAGDLYALVIAVVDMVTLQSYGNLVLIYWLAVNALHLVMAVFFMSGRANFRSNDRFRVEIPAQISYYGKKYSGKTMDLSETGLSILLDKPIYMPHGSEYMEIRLKSERYEAKLRAACVHAKETEKGWRYGLQIKTINEKNRQQYFQILYDRDHSLAKKISASVGAYDDIFLNIRRRLQGNTVSARKLARIELDAAVRTVEGYELSIVNCNYEYLKVSAPTDVPDSFAIAIDGTPYRIACAAVEEKPGLYRIENWRELIYHDAFSVFFKNLHKEAARAESAAV